MTTSYSTQSTVSSGSLSTLALSIEYLARSEISVYINDLLSTAWSWTTPTSKAIQFDDAPLANGTTVLVRRTTDLSAIRHDFSGGAQFTYTTLDEDFKQVLHIAQEAIEGRAVEDLYNDLDMHQYRVRNLADAIADQDAVNFQQLRDYVAAGLPGYTNLGDYGPGLVFTRYDQTFRLDGEFYAPGPSITLPYTTTGIGAAEIANFRSVGDAVLRQDLAVSTGADLVGYGIRTVGDRLADSAHVEDDGAAGDGVADDYAAITAALAAHGAIKLSNRTYRITQKIIVPGANYIISDNATILKDFDGVALEFTGGSAFNYVQGTLNVTASVAQTANTAADSTSPTAHGVQITNNRLIVDGTIISSGHKGNGIEFSSTAPNSNRSIMNLRGRSNGVHGIHFGGTHDDCAVWQVDLFADGNRKSGVHCDDDFTGRAWQGFIYTEANCKDSISAGCYLGKLRASELFIYSEEQAVGAREISLGANSDFMRITSLRRAVDEDFSAASKRNVWVAGQKTYTPGYPGGPRNGVAGSFHAARARFTQAAEYVDVPLLVGNEELVGSLRGYGGPVSPSVGVVSADGFSSILAANDGLRLTFSGALMLLLQAGVILPGADNARALGSAAARFSEGHFYRVRTHGVAVAGLVAAATAGAGARAFVTDASATTFASIVAGGGANGVPVYSDGTNWRIG